MYTSKKDIEEQNGNVVLFNKYLTNIESWDELFSKFYFIGAIVSSIVSYFIINIMIPWMPIEKILLGAAAGAFIGAMLMALVYFIISGLFRPTFAEAMRCG